jgi:hypothetical protein
MTLLPRLSPQSKSKLKARIAVRLSELTRCGYWLCLGCEGINTREEREQGLPAHCTTCGSVWFENEPPAMPDLLEPHDLYD